jgi:ectoine hydroxylase-related dioxygenase (phytanoyl-CoA dioxygenase family)
MDYAEMAELSRNHHLVSSVAQLLGTNDVVLWGAEFLARKAGQVHPWHTDSESARDGFVTVWMGLGNTSDASGLSVIPRSHKYGYFLQEKRFDHGFDTNKTDPSTEQVVRMARDIDSDAKVETPNVQDGVPLFFDGRLWHGTNNTRFDGATRYCVILQYTMASMNVKTAMGERRWLGGLRWPISMCGEKRPYKSYVSDFGGKQCAKSIVAQVSGRINRTANLVAAIHEFGAETLNSSTT